MTGPVFRVPPVIAAHARALAEAEQDPISAFFYDLDGLELHAAAVRRMLPPGIELFYAIKANSEPAILDALAPHVDGFEISSGGEIGRLADACVDKPFVFSGPGKLASELEAARAAGVEAVHVESLAEIDRLAALVTAGDPPQSVLLRINPELPAAITSRLVMAGGPSPFGIDEANLAEAVACVEARPELRLAGFHVHALSHQRDPDRHAALLAHYLARWPVWRRLARSSEGVVQLNVGGGIGVDYLGGEQFDWPALCNRLAARLTAMTEPPRIRFEIGRFLTASCGYYAVQIIDVKDSRGRRFAICRGGTHQFRLPAAQDHDHPIIHLRAKDATPAGAEPLPVTVVGQLCTPKDVLSRDVPMVDPRPGDLLILPLAGAYGYNISHADFLCHPRPRQIFVRRDGTIAPSRSNNDVSQPQREPALSSSGSGVECALLSAPIAAGDPPGLGVDRNRHERAQLS